MSSAWRFNFQGAKVEIEVTWNDAETFCKWASKQLPTEAQWEKAASWDEKKKEKLIFPWGNTFDTSKVNVEGKAGDTTAVGSYSSGASPYGVMDMAGNVWEWVAGWYDSGYYKNSLPRNPTGPSSGQYRVLRGGSWGSFAIRVRAAFRYDVVPDYWGNGLGFRCVE